jgi:predicted MFS family arabinose efflux permease
VAAALGMLLGDLSAGRFLPPRWRHRSTTPLRFVLAVPYLLFALPLSLPVAVGAAAIASTGFAATLLLQERLIAVTGEEVRGQALGLHANGMKAMQAVGAALAGLAAQFMSTGTTMALLAVASLAVTAMLGPGLRYAVGSQTRMA